MFVLAVVEDKLRIAPDQFDRNPTEVLIEQIEIKYCNKVILEVGLCISFYDFVEVDDPYVYPAEGAAYQLVKFRMILFRPFAGEVMTGRLVSSNKDGIRLSLDFFDDITIPSYLMQVPSSFNDETGLWTWKYGDEDASQDFCMSIGEEVRFRVRTINFTSVTASAKGLQTTTTSETHVGSSSTSLMRNVSGGSNDEGSQSMTRRRSSSIGVAPGGDQAQGVPSVMEVLGGINEDGLGGMHWWR